MGTNSPIERTERKYIFVPYVVYKTPMERYKYVHIGCCTYDTIEDARDALEVMSRNISRFYEILTQDIMENHVTITQPI